MQSCTSACTSVNSKRLPKIYGKVLIDGDDSVLDYGCGKYTDHIREYCNGKDAWYYPYDPFNQPTNVNEKTFEELKRDPATIGIISNVLNVIDSDEAVKEVIDRVMELVRGGIYITVYEGDRSGVGKYTGDDSYQRNMKLRDWFELLSKWEYRPTMTNGMIILSNY